MFFNLLYKNLQTVFRVLKNVILRPANLLRSRVSNLFNATSVSKLSTNGQKAFSGFIKKLKLKPEKRDDFVDVGAVFVAKSLMFLLFILLVGIILLIYFFLWPWISQNFFTAKFYQGQKGLSAYTGKVIVFYDKQYKQKMFTGWLEKGVYARRGQFYYKNGLLEYDGNFKSGKYEGYGTSFSEQGKEVYQGNFKAGVYSGEGTLQRTDGTVYKGNFADGKASGKGQILLKNVVIYDGNMKDGMRSGDGKAYYSSGSLLFEGSFNADLYEGDGTEYYEKTGVIKYKGAFAAGVYSGKGIYYSAKGVKQYEGDFANGKYDGTGRLYNSDGSLLYTGTFADGLFDGTGKLIIKKDVSWYDGAFSQGKKSGDGKLYINGQLYYQGNFADNMMSGKGKLTDAASGLNYDGNFINNDIDYGGLFAQTPDKIYAAFTTGMTQDTGKPDAYYLYNKAYGTVMKFSYATATSGASFQKVYTLPVNSTVRKIVTAADIKLSGNYVFGGVTRKSPDTPMCGYLTGTFGGMNCYSVLFTNYTVCYYTDPVTNEVKLIEYYPASNAGQIAKSASAAANVQNTAATAAFQDLGLDMTDFKSLGY